MRNSFASLQKELRSFQEAESKKGVWNRKGFKKGISQRDKRGNTRRKRRGYRKQGEKGSKI